MCATCRVACASWCLTSEAATIAVAEVSNRSSRGQKDRTQRQHPTCSASAHSATSLTASAALSAAGAVCGVACRSGSATQKPPSARNSATSSQQGASPWTVQVRTPLCRNTGSLLITAGTRPLPRGHRAEARNTAHLGPAATQSNNKRRALGTSNLHEWKVFVEALMRPKSHSWQTTGQTSPAATIPTQISFSK